MKNKVLFIANDFDIVLFRFRKEVVQAFVSKNCEVSLVTPLSEKAKNYCDEYGIEFIPLDIDRRGKNLLADLKLLLTYYKIIKKENPDYIFTATIKPNLYVGLVNLFFRKKFFPWVTGLGTVFHNNNLLTKLISLFYKVSFSSAKNVFFENSSNMALFERKKLIKKDKSIVLPGCGINLDEFEYGSYPSEDSGLKFVFIGRIMKEKGVYELLDAFSLIQESYFNTSLKIYGPKDENIDIFLENVGHVENVTYEGFCSSVYEVIKENHILVLPSYHEGLSVTLMEAAAVGRPLLASNISGCREVIDDGVNGLTFEPKSVDSLQKAIEKIMKMSSEQRKNMGLNGRKKIQKEFDRKIVVEEHLSCLRGVK
ncbi:galacturonosyl transferase [Francisella halioticida]|uniref:glycosyltransferase family 4 protein n=1 Tax=Francisella halioticida TaxID=549298 RepID=UPI001AFC5E39|nr:glycosyltransferase family 4 protein [Francisella halioticida]BCD91432.1 galacturonosyl transferase [Francisella halioticida]